MTFTELADLVRTNAQTVRLPARRKGDRRRLATTAQVAAALSTMRSTLLHLIAARHGISHLEACSRLAGGEDVGPYMTNIRAAALEWARGAGHQNPANASGFVRTVTDLAFPGTFTQALSEGGAASVPAAYTSLVEALSEACRDAKPRTRHAQCNMVRTFARQAWAAGWESPTDLPEGAAGRMQIEAAFVKAGLSKAYANNTINSYNRAAQLLNDRGGAFPVLPERVDGRQIGLRTLPAAAFCGAIADPTHASVDALLAAVAPRVAKSWAAYVASPAGVREKLRLREGRGAALGRLVAELWRRRALLARARVIPGALSPVLPPFAAGRELAEFQLMHLYTLEVPVVESTAAAEAAGVGVAADVLEGVGLNDLPTVYRPLIRVVLDGLAQDEGRSARNGAARSTLPYPGAVVALNDQTIRVVRVTFPSLEDYPGLEPLLKRIEYEHSEVYRHMAAENGKAVKNLRVPATTMHKKLLLEVLTLPHLICIGLPRLAREVRALERVYHAARATAESKGHPVPDTKPQVREARDAWYESLERYLALAVFTAHPLRVSNLAYGRLGDANAGEFKLTVEYAADGTPVRITEVRTYFDSRLPENPEARIKQPEKEQVWRWSPAVVDFDLLLAYLLGPRKDRIVERGLLDDPGAGAVGQDGATVVARVTHETYSLRRDLEDAQLTLFISPIGPFEGDPRRYRGGHGGVGTLSGWVGEGMHRVATLLWPERVIPPYDACGGDEAWHRLFTGHNVRLLWSTYWHGLRSSHAIAYDLTSPGRTRTGTAIAIEATTDTEKTLTQDYTEVSAAMVDRLRDRPDEWTHPHAHNAWMDRVYRTEPIDWLRETVLLPPHLEALTPLAEKPDARRRQRRSRSVGRAGAAQT